MDADGVWRTLAPELAASLRGLEWLTRFVDEKRGALIRQAILAIEDVRAEFGK